MSDTALEQDYDRQIVAVHKRFVKAMNARLDGMSLETKERYYAVLSALTAKLESGEKTLKEIMQEMMAEAASMILQEMQA